MISECAGCRSSRAGRSACDGGGAGLVSPAVLRARGKVSRIRDGVGEYLLTGFEAGEEKLWLLSSTELREERKAGALARFLGAGEWGPDYHLAAVFPHVMAQDIERAFRALTYEGVRPLYFTLACSDERLEAERTQRHRALEAMAEASVEQEDAALSSAGIEEYQRELTRRGLD